MSDYRYSGKISKDIMPVDDKWPDLLLSLKSGPFTVCQPP